MKKLRFRNGEAVKKLRSIFGFKFHMEPATAGIWKPVLSPRLRMKLNDVRRRDFRRAPKWRQEVCELEMRAWHVQNVLARFGGPRMFGRITNLNTPAK